MSDRLTELLRQRALLQEHAAWLEGEIAAESARGGLGQANSPAPVPTASAPTDAAEADAENIIEQYRDEAKNVHHDVRRGCFFYFAVALLLLGAAVVSLYLYTVKRH